MSKLHPKVAEFKEFVKRHPKIAQDVRSNKKTWQEFYEDWYIFGEEDSMWEPYKTGQTEDHETEKETKKKDNDFMSQMLAMVKNIDMNEMQKNLNNVSGAIANVQKLLEQFQSFKGTNNEHSHRVNGPRNPHNPFFFRRD